MLKHLPRLLAIWTVLARYRLDTLLPRPMPPAVQAAVLLLRLHPLWWLSGRRAAQPDRLRLAFEELGPLFIKLGQLLSTRRDLFPPAVLDELAKLQDQVAPFSSTLARQIVEQELGAPISDRFSRFDDEPLAAASIAQVHTAALPDGRDVIVKIVRPDVEARARADMALLKDGARLLEARFPDAVQFHPLRIVRDYERTLLDEMDLAREAANTRRFRANFLGSDLLYVPEIHDDWCTSRVMVAERIHGVPVSDLDSFARLGISREVLAHMGFTIFFTQVFRDNFFHADMHPGNIYVETRDPARPRYIALDCAIAGQLAREDQLAVARILMALVQRDFRQLVQVAAQAGWIPADVSQTAVSEEVQRLVEPVLSKPIDQVNLGPTLMGLLDMARQYRLEIPAQFVLLLKTLIHVEGLGRNLYPSLDIWSLARPMLTDWLKERIGPAAMARRIGESAPGWLIGLPDMPQLVFDALSQMRQHGHWQERQLQEVRTLRAELLRARKRDFLALAAMATGGALFALQGGALAASGLVLAVAALGWRVLTR